MQVTIVNAMDVNCYLLQGDGGYVLVDSGFAFKRHQVDKHLVAAGLQPGQLKLIFHTHADGDHAGNSAWLTKKYGGTTALHPLEVESVRTGNMLRARSHTPALQKFILTLFLPLVGIPRSSRFKPDLLLEDEQVVTDCGMDAVCLHLPGHSSGSCGLLTSDGSLFCGDLFTNFDHPQLNTNLDDPGAAQASLQKLHGYKITTVFPGHGRPFPITDLTDW